MYGVCSGSLVGITMYFTILGLRSFNRNITYDWHILLCKYPIIEKSFVNFT